MFEEELFGPAEGLHSTFRIMRDELLDTVARVGGRLAEMRLDTYLDVDQAVARYLELIKVAALIERAREGQTLDDALPEVNEILLQVRHARAARDLRDLGARRLAARHRARPERRAGRGAERLRAVARPVHPAARRRADAVGVRHRHVPASARSSTSSRASSGSRRSRRSTSASGSSCTRCWSASTPASGARSSSCRSCSRSPGGARASATPTTSCSSASAASEALERYWEADRDSQAEPVWFERSFAFKLGPHLLRGRVDRVDRQPDGSYELIDYKTGKAKTEEELREDVQLSLYQMGARESWQLETSAQSYYYVLTGEKVPVEHSAEELERVSATVAEIADGILAQEFEPQAVVRHLPLLRLPDHLPAAEKSEREVGRQPRAASRHGLVRASRWRRKRWKSRAIVSADGIWSSLVASASTSSIALSSRSTNALTSGSLATAALTWRS